MIGLWLALALASDEVPEVSSSRAFVAAPLMGRPLLELRGGVDSFSSAQAPVICGEVHLLRFLSVDACGSGSKLLHDRPLDEQSHYRVEADVPLASSARGELWLQPGVGFTEVQRGADAGGFRFGREVAAGQVEASGAELSASAKGRLWVHEGVYTVAEANLSLAHVPGAPAAVGTPATLPSASLTVGLGF